MGPAARRGNTREVIRKNRAVFIDSTWGQTLQRPATDGDATRDLRSIDRVAHRVGTRGLAADSACTGSTHDSTIVHEVCVA